MHIVNTAVKLLIALLFLASCSTLTKKKSSKEEIKVKYAKAAVDSSMLQENSNQYKTVNLYRSIDFASYLDLTPTDPKLPAIHTIFQDGQEVFRQEVQNGSLKSSMHKTDSITVYDTIYQDRIQYIYKYKFDTIYVGAETITSAESSQEPATISLLLKLIPWWWYALFVLSLLVIVFWKALKTYLKTLPIVGRFIK